MVPNGWSALHLKDVSQKIQDGNYGADYPKGEELVASGIPFLTSKVIGGNGTVNHGKFDYISEEKHKKLKKAQITSGDILFTNRGANVGTIAIIPDFLKMGNIGPQLTLIRCNENIEKNYLFQFLRGSFFQKQVRQQDSGSAMNFFGIKDTERFKVLVPPLPEQKKIAQILSTWDKAITTTEQLIANSQQHKKALMQKLLTGKIRLLDKNGVRFSEEWRRVELGELLDYQQPTPYLVESTEYSDEYTTPVLTAGKTFILGYTNEKSGVFSEELPVIIFDDFTTDCKFVEFPFKAKSSAMKILTAKNSVSIKYIYEAMQLLDFAVGGHQRHWISIYSRLVIPFPEREEQQKIATILSTSDKEINTLQQKLDTLKQEKKALMQQLLTGKRRVNLGVA